MISIVSLLDCSLQSLDDFDTPLGSPNLNSSEPLIQLSTPESSDNEMGEVAELKKKITDLEREARTHSRHVDQLELEKQSLLQEKQTLETAFNSFKDTTETKILNKIDTISASDVDNSAVLNHEIPIFYGRLTDDFGEWIENFELVAKSKGWADAKKARVLPTRLKENALEHFKDLDSAVSDDWSEAVKALKSKLNPAENLSFSCKELMQRKQGPSENVSEYGHAIKRLVKNAFPYLSVDDQDRIGKEYYVVGLKNHIGRAVMFHEPSTLKSAVDKAERHEAQLRVMESSEFSSGSNYPVYALEAKKVEKEMSSILPPVTSKLNPNAEVFSAAEEKPRSAEMEEILTLKRRFDGFFRSRDRNFNNRGTGRGFSHNPPMRQRRALNGAPICDYCGVRGHIKAQCFKRQNAHGRHSAQADKWRKSVSPNRNFQSRSSTPHGSFRGNDRNHYQRNQNFRSPQVGAISRDELLSLRDQVNDQEYFSAPIFMEEIKPIVRSHAQNESSIHGNEKPQGSVEYPDSPKYDFIDDSNTAQTIELDHIQPQYQDEYMDLYEAFLDKHRKQNSFKPSPAKMKAISVASPLILTKKQQRMSINELMSSRIHPTSTNTNTVATLEPVNFSRPNRRPTHFLFARVTV